MIIIGLLIGGILKGQELIANAQLNKTAAQIKGIRAAFVSFRDIYNAIPGDMLRATAHLPNCGGATCRNGNGNGVLTYGPNTGVLPNSENIQFWLHMNKADLLSGVQEGGALVFGEALPAAAIGGGFRAGWAPAGGLNGATAGNAVGLAKPGHWLGLTPETTNINFASVFIPANLMRRLDIKLDDGAPNDGSVRAIGRTGAASIHCASGTQTNAIYNESIQSLCGAYIYLQ